MNAYDVVVAGAGPVGLMLACELELAGVSTLVLERLTEPSLTIKAGSVNVPTTDAFYRRGMIEALAEVHRAGLERMAAFIRQRAPQAAAGSSAKPKVMLGHFAGMMTLDPTRLDPGDPDVVVGPANDAMLVSQQDLERILAERADELGVTVLRGAEVTGFTQDQDGVRVEHRGGTVRAGWLVGCDGGRSTVRRLAGFDFPGTDPTITGHQALVDIADPEKLPLGWNRMPQGMLVHGPVAGRILTVEFDGPPVDRDAPITLAELQTSLRRVSGTDVTITAVHTATRFTDNARQASSYRLGRVLLAGDAAHVHSPFGGQGLNTGIQDAVNLGWKLAAAVHGRAPEELLDTYTAERHPIGARVLDWSRAQVALMRPDEQVTALRGVVADLIGTDGGNAYMVKMVGGLSVRYDLGGDHEMVGRRAPELLLDNGSRLGELAADGRALLLDLTGSAGTLARGWGDRLHLISARCAERPALGCLLVRPDGFVAFASDGEPDQESLRSVLHTWFGAPVAVPQPAA